MARIRKQDSDVNAGTPPFTITRNQLRFYVRPQVILKNGVEVHYKDRPLHKDATGRKFVIL